MNCGRRKTVETKKQIAEVFIRLAITYELRNCTEPLFESWAKKWLSGEDRSGLSAAAIYEAGRSWQVKRTASAVMCLSDGAIKLAAKYACDVICAVCNWAVPELNTMICEMMRGVESGFDSKTGKCLFENCKERRKKG